MFERQGPSRPCTNAVLERLQAVLWRVLAGQRFVWRVDSQPMNAVRQATSTQPTEATLQWVREAVGAGSVIAGLRPMGVASTAMHALDVVGPTGVLHKLSLRR